MEGGHFYEKQCPKHRPEWMPTVDVPSRRHGVIATARVTNMAKALRRGKVLVDWSQNDRHKSTVSSYSLRARPRPSVAIPLPWEEVEALAGRGPRDVDRLLFAPGDVLARIDPLGDLAEPLLGGAGPG